MGEFGLKDLMLPVVLWVEGIEQGSKLGRRCLVAEAFELPTQGIVDGSGEHLATGTQFKVGDKFNPDGEQIAWDAALLGPFVVDARSEWL